MNFPSDIKGAMKDCILGIFWPKKNILSFFEDNGCTKADISALGEYKDLNRSGIVDKMFSHLSSKPDFGLGPLRAMLQSLVGWSHFDPYYFDKLRKLDKDKALRSINHLKQIQEIRDHKTKEKRKKREQREKNKQNPQKTIEELKERYILLFKGEVSNQKRGYELERILQEMSKISCLEVTEPFRVKGEQIDGAVKYDGEHYILEAKWQDKASASDSVYHFAQKVEGKMYGRGLFVSVNGFSEEVIDSLLKGKAVKTIFVDGGDIALVLESHLSFAEMLDKKIKAAQTKGLIYVDPLTGKVK